MAGGGEGQLHNRFAVAHLSLLQIMCLLFLFSLFHYGLLGAIYDTVTFCSFFSGNSLELTQCAFAGFINFAGLKLTISF